jgi:hypothetical protein
MEETEEEEEKENEKLRMSCAIACYKHQSTDCNKSSESLLLPLMVAPSSVTHTASEPRTAMDRPETSLLLFYVYFLYPLVVSGARVALFT